MRSLRRSRDVARRAGARGERGPRLAFRPGRALDVEHERLQKKLESEDHRDRGENDGARRGRAIRAGICHPMPETEDATEEKQNQTEEKEHGDGIRFYLSTYDKEYIGNKQPHQPERAYWGYNTLIMVSTQYINGNHVDYYTNSVTSNPRGHGFIVMTVPENRGELCPPPANCKDIGATLLDN